MKKILIKIGIALIVLLVVGILAVSFFLDGAIKRGVETLGPKLTKVDVKLDKVSLSLLSGAGKINGLVVGNPVGFKTPQAISVGSASLALKPGSLLSDKIIITSIQVEAPEITLEIGLNGNNLGKILANLQGGAGGGATTSTNAAPVEQKAGKKLEVDEFLITGAKLNASLSALGGKSFTAVLPAIHLKDLGRGPDGITAGELTRLVLAEIEKAALKAAGDSGADLDKLSKNLSKELGKSIGNEQAEKVTKGIGDLFKKK
jgi:uncharacterized protein involved in outer membrane biogenesis